MKNEIKEEEKLATEIVGEPDKKSLQFMEHITEEKCFHSEDNNTQMVEGDVKCHSKRINEEDQV